MAAVLCITYFSHIASLAAPTLPEEPEPPNSASITDREAVASTYSGWTENPYDVYSTTPDSTNSTTTTTIPGWATETDIFGNTLYVLPSIVTTTTSPPTSKKTTTVTTTEKPTTTTKKTAHTPTFVFNPDHPEDTDFGGIPRNTMPDFGSFTVPGETKAPVTFTATRSNGEVYSYTEPQNEEPQRTMPTVLKIAIPTVLGGALVLVVALLLMNKKDEDDDEDDD
jgi:hypothetical protein